MAQIPDSIAEPQFANAQISPEAAGAPGRAVEGVGQAVTQFAEQQQALDRENQATDAVTKTLPVIQQIADKWGQVPDRDGAEQGFLGDAKSTVDQTLAGISDPYVQARVHADLGQKAAALAGSVYSHAFALQSDKQVADLEKTSKDFGQQLVAASGNPDLQASIHASFQRSVQTALDNHLILPTRAQAFDEEFASRGAEVDVERARNALLLDGPADPKALWSLAREVDDPNSFAGLLPKDRDRLTLKIRGYAEQAQHDQDRAEAKAENARIRGVAAAQGPVSAAYQDDIASIGATGQPVSPDTEYRIRQAYPADLYPGQADRLVGDLHTAQQLYTAGQQVALASPDQERQIVAGLAPAGAGFAEQQKRQGLVVQAIQAKRQALTGDPAGYVLSQAPEIQAQFQTAAQDPSQLPAAIGSLDAAYDRLGVAPADRRVLPKAQSQETVRQLLATPADQRAAQIESLAAATGAAWPRVMDGLVRDGNLPREYNFLAALPDPGSRTLFADALGDGKTKSAAQALPEPDQKTIRDALKDDPSLMALRKSFAPAAGGDAAMASIDNGVALLAQRLALNGDVDSAAPTAVGRLMSRYDLWQQGGQVARLPRGLAAPIQSQAATALAGLTPDAVAPAPNASGLPLTDEQLRQLALRSAQGGAWVTNENESGLVRLGSDGRPVTMANGVRLEVPFPAQPAAGGAVFQLPAPSGSVPGKASGAMARDLERAATAHGREPVHPRAVRPDLATP